MREAHVRWCGFDPTTGIAWDDSWVRQSWLTPDLRAGGVIRRRRTAAQIREDERRDQEIWVGGETYSFQEGSHADLRGRSQRRRT